MASGKVTAELADIEWNKKVRVMESDDSRDIVLPAAFALVFKRIEDYDMQSNKVDLKLTVILRVKLTDIEKFIPENMVEPLKDHLRKKLKLRI